jgi:hypothetical protein
VGNCSFCAHSKGWNGIWAKCSETSRFDRHALLMAQRLGREFSKKKAVVPGEAAELPNTKLDSGIGHTRY